MLKFVIKRNSQHPGTGEIESTYDTVLTECSIVEKALLQKWNGMNDAAVVECRIFAGDVVSGVTAHNYTQSTKG